MTQTDPKRIFLVINKYAGHHKGELAVDFVVPYLKKNGCEVNYSLTQYPGHASELAIKASADGYDMVVAVGGDGTVNEVAQSLIGTDTPLGIIPIGSGNGLARELGLSTNIKKSARTLMEGKTLRIDVCSINNQRFLCTGGIGFDAQIAQLMSTVSSRGFFRYMQLVVRESIFYKPTKIRMKIDGVLLDQSVFLVTFANASQFGNNAFIAPGASMTDGIIDVIVVKPFSRFWLPVFGIGLFTKIIPKLPFVDCYKAKQIDLELADTPYYHFDGEPGKLQTPAVIKLDAEKIWVRCRN
ncbi:MAG: diacylglycerol kinase family lipid kinase [Prolixibacteraceae bacterium]|nr:diacylglycerol kinase family lipid kinase [Prolixibacteraceae bacterium]